MGTDGKLIDPSEDDVKKHNARLKHILKDSQKENFIKTAQSLDCDESETAFNAKLKALAKAKPQAESEKSEEPTKP